MNNAFPASAVSLPADPIFAAIEAARAARIAYEQAREPMEAIWRAHPETRFGFIFTANIGGEEQKVATLERLNGWMDRQGPAHAIACKRTFAETAALVLGIEEPAVADPAPEALEAWEAERAAIVAAFERAKLEHEVATARHALPAIYERIEKASDASEAADDNALDVTPTTPAGGLTLLRFTVEMMERFGSIPEFMPALNAAMTALEGGQ